MHALSLDLDCMLTLAARIIHDLPSSQLPCRLDTSKSDIPKGHIMLNRFILPALIVLGLVVHLTGPSLNGGTVLALAATVALILRVTRENTTNNI